MPRVLVLYYSSYGHIEAMAYAQAEGAGRIAGAQVTVKRVPELTPPEVARAAGFKLDQRAPLARPGDRCPRAPGSHRAPRKPRFPPPEYPCVSRTRVQSVPCTRPARHRRGHGDLALTLLRPPRH